MNKTILGDVTVVSSGQGAPQGEHNYSNEGTPFIKAGNLDQLTHGKKISEICQKVSEETARKHRLTLYPKGTLVFAKSGMSSTKNRVYELLEDAYVVNHLATIIPNEGSLVPGYLKYFLQKFKPSRLIKDESYPSISLADIKRIEIQLPNISDQIKIIESLDSATQLKQKRKEALKLLDVYLESVFVDMFGDLFSNSMGWEKVKLHSLLDKLTSGSRGWAKYYSDSGDIFFTIKNVGRKNKLILDNLTFVKPPDNAEAKRTLVQTNDVLMSVTADLGRTVVVPKLDKKAYINQHLVILRLNNNANPVFISHLISTPWVQAQISKLNKGAAKAGLNFNDINSIDILLPPKELQDKYANIVDVVEVLRAKMLNQSEELDNHFNALMQEALSLR